MRAVLAALAGSRSSDEAVERASSEVGKPMTHDSLRKRLANHRDCCNAPTVGQLYGSPFSATVAAQRRYGGAPVRDLDDDERDTQPGMRAPTPAPSSDYSRRIPPPAVGAVRDDLRGVQWDDFDAPPAPPPARQSKTSEVMARIHSAVKRGPVSFADLCDVLDMSPSKARAAVDEARAAGLRIDVEHDHIGIRPTLGETEIQEIGIPPVVGERFTVGVISDLHYGSKYCLRSQLSDFVHHAHDQGARHILVPGDLLDGCYKHGLWELSHHGLDEQADDMIENLPRIDGLQYHAITGNHDETFEDTCGIHVGPYIQDRFRSKGRSDIRFYGRRGAWLRIGGAVVEMWHPRGGGSYAKSYKLQKKIEAYQAGQKPHLLLVGHWHQFCALYERGVHGFLCPTFQGGGSSFGKSLGGAPTIGGLTISWELTAGGTMRRFAHEYSAYFEAERVFDVAQQEVA